MDYENLTFIALSCSGSSPEFREIIKLVADKVRYVTTYGSLEIADAEKTPLFMNIFIPSFLETLLNNTNYQSLDTDHIIDLLNLIQDLGLKFLQSGEYKDDVYRIITYLFTKSNPFYQKTYTNLLTRIVWDVYIEKSKNFFKRLTDIVRDYYGDDDSIFKLIFDIHKLSGKIQDLRICMDTTLQQYAYYLFNIQSILEDNPQKIKEYNFKSLRQFIELISDPLNTTVEASPILNFLTILLDSQQHTIRQLGADSISAITNKTLFKPDVIKWAKQENIKNLLLSAKSISLHASLSPVIKVLLRHGDISFEEMCEFYNKCVKAQVPETTISDFILTYSEELSERKQNEIFQKIENSEINETNVLFLAKLLTSMKNNKQKSIEFMMKWSSDENLSQEIRDNLMDELIEIANNVSHPPQSLLGYAAECFKNDKFEQGRKIYLRFASLGILPPEIPELLISQEGQARQLGFEIITKTAVPLGDLNTKKYAEKIDDYFWKFICDLLAESKISQYGEQFTYVKQLAAESDFTKATEHLVKLLMRTGNENSILLFCVIEDCQDKDVVKTAISHLSDLAKGSAGIKIRLQVLKYLKEDQTKLIKIIPIIKSFFTDLTTTAKYVKYNMVPHFCKSVVHVTFQLHNKERDAEILPDEDYMSLKDQASTIFEQQVELLGWSYSDSVKSKNIKDGDVIHCDTLHYLLGGKTMNHPVLDLLKENITDKYLKIVNEGNLNEEDNNNVVSLLNLLPTSRSIMDTLADREGLLKLLNSAQSISFVNYVLEAIQRLPLSQREELFEDSGEIIQKLIEFIEVKSSAEMKQGIVAILSEYMSPNKIKNVDSIVKHLMPVYVDNDSNDDIKIGIIKIFIKLAACFPDRISDLMEENIGFVEQVLENMNNEISEPFNELLQKIDIMGAIFELVKDNILEDKVVNKFVIDILRNAKIGESFGKEEYLHICLKLMQADDFNNISAGVEMFKKLAEISDIVDSEDTINFLFYHMLTMDNMEFKQQIFDMITEVADEREVYAKTVEEFCQKLVQLKIERFNYDCTLFSQNSSRQVGMLNLGSTCFFNAVIQQLFHIPLFTYQILTTEFKDLAMKKFQYLIAELLLSEQRYADPKPFLDEWNGWNNQKINVRDQQDASEFVTIFIDSLPQEMQITFKGSSVGTVKDLSEKVLKRIQEDFTTMSLQVRSFSNMEASLNGLLSPEMLTGDNQYEIDGTKIDAKHITRLKQIPPILMLQLRRFEFNTRNGRRDKINDKFDISLKINIAPLLEDYETNKSHKEIYKLHGIIMHSGSADSGHYISYVRMKQGWVEFNDSEVSRVEQDYVLNRAAAKGSIENCNAYLLVYMKEDFVCTDKDGNLIEFETLKNYIPQKTRENIEKMNELFLYSQFAFSKIFLKYMNTVTDFKMKMNFFFHIFLHADYKDLPKIFLKSVLNDANSSHENIMTIIDEHTQDIIEIYVYMTQDEVLTELDNFIISFTGNLYNDEKVFQFYGEIIKSLDRFVENRMNIKNYLKLINYYMKLNYNKCKQFYNYIEDFFDKSYAKAEGMATTYKTSLYIGDIFEIMEKYMFSVKQDLLAQYAESIVMTYSNRKPFLNLVIEMLNRNLITPENFITITKANPSSMFAELKPQLNKICSNNPEIISSLFESFPSFRDDAMKHLASRTSDDDIRACQSLSRYFVQQVFNPEEEIRQNAISILGRAFKVFTGEENLENDSSLPDFIPTIDIFFKEFANLPTIIRENSDNQFLKSIFTILNPIYPYMTEFEDQVLVDTLSSAVRPDDAYTIVRFCAMLGTDFAVKRFKTILKMCIDNIPSTDQQNMSPQNKAMAGALTCFAMNLPPDSEELNEFLREKLTKAFYNHLEIYGKESPEYQFLTRVLPPEQKPEIEIITII